MILLSFGNDDIDDVRETAAALSALLHGVIDAAWRDQLPLILIKQALDDTFNGRL
ncbi:hypothetical protein [Roseibium sp.]|uniref:hypothetical protein n=1 Tax=Roseibium sp. TaxID=1936156 RepID=UPI003D14F0AF